MGPVNGVGACVEEDVVRRSVVAVHTIAVSRRQGRRDVVKSSQSSPHVLSSAGTPLHHLRYTQSSPLRLAVTRRHLIASAYAKINPRLLR